MTTGDRLTVLPANERNALETLLMNFDQAWEPDLLPAYFKSLSDQKSEPFRRLALSELVKIDMQRCWSIGQGRTLEAYLKQYPLLGDVETIDSELILIEFTARRSTDPTLSLESYAQRYPNQYDDLVRAASKPIDSSPTPRKEPTAADKASIETSRIGNIGDTKGKKSPNPADLPIEFGRYRILRELGSGAMGTVHLAHDTQLDRQIALKTPSFQSENEDEMVTRFYREARAAAKIQHRNICPIYDVGEINGQHFISMAFINGRTMSDLIKPDKLPPPKTSAILVHRLALALAEAHRFKVIHRDLKPANIMIDRKREPVVMDFGLARQTDIESRMTQSGMLLGTPAYMSPEQLSGKPDDVGPQSDIFSLGVILYELLTGKLPFNGSLAQVVSQILQVEPTPPSQLRKSVPPGLEAICATMMAKDQAQRYQTMSDVAAAIKNYLDGGDDKQSSNRPVESTAPKAKPRKPAESVSETGVLNEFFAAQAANDPLQTAMESSRPKPQIPMAVPLHSAGGKTVKTIQTKPVTPKPGAKKTFFASNTKWIAAGLVGILIPAALGIVFFIVTPYGTIRVETIGELDGLEVLVDGNTISLNDSKRAKAKGHELELMLRGVHLRLDPKTNQFIVTDSGTEKRLTVSVGDVQLASKSFTVTRNRETVLKIELLSVEHASSLPTAAKETNSRTMQPAQQLPLIETNEQMKLVGWEPLGLDGWSIRGGVLTGQPSSKKGVFDSWLIKQGDFDDFELEFEYKLEPGGNSGVFFRAVRDKDLTSNKECYEIQLLDDTAARYADIPAHQRNGSLWDKLPAKPSQRLGPNQWHRMKIRVDSDQLQVWSNDQRIVDGKIPPNKLAGKRIGLQLHTGKVQFRDMQIRDLDSVDAKPDNSADNRKWTNPFNGRDLSGWIGHVFKGKTKSTVWEWKDGELIGKTPRKRLVYNTVLASEKKYKDFEIEFEAKLEGSNPNSGLQIRSRLNNARTFVAEGPQVDIGPGVWGDLYGERADGIMKKADAELVKQAIRPDDYNHYGVRCVGQQVTITVNGTTLVDKKFPSMAQDGILAWQLHRGDPMTVRFRNVRIRELNTESEANRNGNEAAVGHGAALVSPKTVFTSPVDEAIGYDKRNNYAVAFSPTGEIVDTANEASTLRIRNVVTGDVTPSSIDRQGVQAVAWSNDGSLLALGLKSGKIEVWKDGAAEPTHTLQVPNKRSMRSVAFSPDNSVVFALGAEASMFVSSWSLEDRSLLVNIDVKNNGVLHNRRVFGSDINSDRSLAALASGYGVQIWSLKTKQLLRTIVADGASDKGYRVGPVEFSRDGKRIGWADARHLRIAEVSTGKILHEIVPSGQIYAVAFSPNGKDVVTCSNVFKHTTGQDGVVEREDTQHFEVWDLDTGTQLRRWSCPGGFYTRHLVFSADGRYLAAAGYGFPLRVWDLEKETGDAVEAAGNGITINAGRDRELLKQELGQRSIIFEESANHAFEYDKKNNYAVVFSPNGEIVDTANPAGTMRIRNVATGEDVRSPTDRQGIEAVAWSADRSQMVLGLLGGTIEVWEDGQPQPTHSFRMSGSPSIRRVMFSPDNGRVIACGDLRAEARRLVESWSLADGSSLGKIEIESNHRGRPTRVFGLDVSPDGSIAAIASGHGVQMWSLETNQLLRTIVTENISDFRAEVNTIVFSNDGKVLGVGGYHNLNIVEVSTGKILHTLITPRDKISAIAFSPNGHSVVSGSWFVHQTAGDGVKKNQVRQRFVEWDLATGRQIREWQSPGSATPRHLVFSADGRYLAAAGHLFPIRVWDTARTMTNKEYP